REHDEQVERNLELLPTGEREEVDAAIERHDPAGQEVERPDALAPEVVDDEKAVVGTHLHRRGVEAGRRIELEAEHLDRQLAADHEAWPPALHPAEVAAHAAARIDLLVHVGVVDSADLPVDLD